MLLLERIFPTSIINSISIVHNPRGIQGDNFSYTNEFAVFVIPAGQRVIAPRRLEELERDPSPLRNWGGESRREDARNCFYPIYVEGREIIGFGDVAPDDFHLDAAVINSGDGRYEVWPIDHHGVERKWRYARDSVERIKGQLSVARGRSGPEIKLTKDVEQYKTVWRDPKYDSNTHGSQLVGKLIGEEFPFPKSLYAVYEVLYACTALRPNALIVDFFAGSGTTLHATCLLNTEDDGQRRCILVTNNEVEDKVAKKLNRAGHFRGDREYERHGIFEKIAMPRCVAAITGVRPDGRPIPGTYDAGDGRPLARGFEENVEFFRLDYLDADEVDLGMRFDAILPALWLASGGVGPRQGVPTGVAYSVPDGARYAVLFRESRFKEFRTALEKHPEVTNVYLVTDSEEAFAEMRAALPARLTVSMLYGDYLRSFRADTEQYR